MTTIKKKAIKKVYVVINPFSGSAKNNFPFLNFLLGIKTHIQKSLSHEKVIKIISKEFSRYNVELSSFVTQDKFHATQIAKEAVKKDVDVIIAVGGDGTINEIINGIANTKVILAVIPYGTANLFCIEFNYLKKIEEICLKVMQGNYKKIDLGKVNEKYFACMVGIGFDAYVIKKADRYLKQIYGALSYLIVAVKEYLNYKFYPITVTIDGEKDPIKGYFVVVGNIKYYGGNLVIAPQADPTDGFLDVCVFKSNSIYNTIKCGIKMKLGILKSCKYVSFFQTKKLAINSSGNHSIHADAEYYCKGSASICVAENALRIVN